VEAEVQRAS
jgi:hypothetical protein